MKNISGCIRVYRGKWYVVIYWYEGRTRHSKQLKTGLDEKGNKRKAMKMLQEKIIEFSALCPPAVAYSDMQFSDYCEIWLDAVQFEVARSTFMNYKGIVTRHIIPYFEDNGIKITDIHRDDVQEFYKALAQGSPNKQALSAKMISRVHAMMKMIFNYAVDGDVIVKNPCLRTKRPKVPRREVNFYNIAECREMLKCLADSNICDLVRVALMYGLRRSELLGLKWSAVDLVNDVLHINHTVTKMDNEVIESDQTKTESSTRSFIIEPVVHKLFEDIKARESENRVFFGNGYHENDFVFKQENGMPFDPNYVTNRFSYLLKKNNLRHIRFHDLRHSCASILYEMGYEIKEIQEWLGHSSPKITLETYTHLFKDRTDKVSRQLSNVFFGESDISGIRRIG